MSLFHIYTDGSCKGNPGNGGFGVVVTKEENQNIIITHTFSKKCENTTNNREELKAILYAFDFMQNHKKDSSIIYSDSAYCVNICNDWIFKWANNNWKRKGNKDIENIDLIQNLYKYINTDFFNCQVKKIKGHEGYFGNELADKLATHDILSKDIKIPVLIDKSIFYLKQANFKNLFSKVLYI